MRLSEVKLSSSEVSKTAGKVSLIQYPNPPYVSKNQISEFH